MESKGNRAIGTCEESQTDLFIFRTHPHLRIRGVVAACFTAHVGDVLQPCPGTGAEPVVRGKGRSSGLRFGFNPCAFKQDRKLDSERCLGWSQTRR